MTMWIDRSLGAGYLLMGSSVLLGWAARIPELVVHGEATMQPATAMGFVLLGAGMWLPMARGKVALVLLVLGASVMGAYALDLGHPLDTWPVRPWVSVGAPIPGRMSPATAASFVLVGALRFLPAARNAVASLGIIASLPMLIVSVVGGPPPPAQSAMATAMSPVTAWAFATFWTWVLYRLHYEPRSR